MIVKGFRSLALSDSVQRKQTDMRNETSMACKRVYPAVLVASFWVSQGEELE